VTNNATLAFNRGFASDTVSNNISGTGALTMFGNRGGLTLAGSNSYSGLTTIGSGYTLQIGTGSTNGTLGSGSVFNAGTLSFNRSDLYTASNAISGAGAIRQIGTGTTTLSGSNTYTGTTSISAGTLIVASTGSLSSSNLSISGGATFRYNGSSSLASSITLGVGGAGRAVLGGTGTINSAVALDWRNDVLSPGNSPGVLNFTPGQTWSSFTYDWELNNFTGTTAGVDFDQISIAGALNLSGSNYTLNVISLTAGNVPGDVPNFTEVSTSWTILVAAGGISGFDDREWIVDTNSFSALGGTAGRFTISQSVDNTTLNLNYIVPEPSTYALLLLAGAGWLLWRRRKVAL
jgi:autotransporter-associated beta strand protein